MAVLDSKFRVRGVQGLRVVDASIYPKIPGTFTALSTYMVAEKAADVVLADAGSSSTKLRLKRFFRMI
jgi:choline dehydrogenase